MEALATTDFSFLDGITGQLVNAGSLGPTPDPKGINFMLSVIKGIEPKDQMETWTCPGKVEGLLIT